MGYSLGEVTNYVIFTNPLSRGMIWAGTGVAKKTGIISSGGAVVQPIIWPELQQLAGSNIYFSRLGGLSGAVAVCLSVYQTKRNRTNIDDYDDPKVDLRNIFDTTNRFHFLHSLALIAVPLVRRPLTTGVLMTTGMALYCGSGYYYAFTGKAKQVRFCAAVGTCILIMAWFSVAL